jgi:hypothetical protein
MLKYGGIGHGPDTPVALGVYLLCSIDDDHSHVNMLGFFLPPPQ